MYATDSNESLKQKYEKENKLLNRLHGYEAAERTKFLNKYLYRKFLHDVGERYLNEQEFKTCLLKHFNNIEFSTFHSPIGNYMIADINIKKNHNCN